MTLTVTHWLLHHHVTVEFQGSMGKFVQLSTQIRTYRNCRGGWLCVCDHVCIRKHRFPRGQTECWKHTHTQKEHSHSSYWGGVGGIPGAEGKTPPCILHTAVQSPPAEQTSPWPETIRPQISSLQGRPPNPTSELEDTGKTPVTSWRSPQI